jgi:hypothetical protein
VVNSISQASKLNNCMEENERKMCGCIKHVVQYENNNGGWNVCQWMREGIQTGAAEQDKRVQEKVTTEGFAPNYSFRAGYHKCNEHRGYQSRNIYRAVFLRQQQSCVLF